MDEDDDSDGDRSAYSSIGQKIANSANQKNDLIVLDYENLSGMSGEDQEETKQQ